MHTYTPLKEEIFAGNNFCGMRGFAKMNRRKTSNYISNNQSANPKSQIRENEFPQKFLPLGSHHLSCVPSRMARGVVTWTCSTRIFNTRLFFL